MFKHTVDLEWSWLFAQLSNNQNNSTDLELLDKIDYVYDSS